MLAFTFAGLISAVGGILLAARLGSASAVQGSDNMMFSVAAVFLGMTVIKSGRANLVGTMVGVAIIGVMSNGLNILGVNAYVQQVVTGLIIIAAVTLSSLRTRQGGSPFPAHTPSSKRNYNKGVVKCVRRTRPSRRPWPSSPPRRWPSPDVPPAAAGVTTTPSR
jgi:hypothetical protein